MISAILFLASLAFAADPCLPFQAGEGNAVLNTTKGVHGESCVSRTPGVIILNNADPLTGGGQPKEAGEYEAMNSAYVIVVDGRPLHQWIRQRVSDPLPEGAVIIEAPFHKDDRGTLTETDDFVWVSVGVAIDAPTTIAGLVGAREVLIPVEGKPAIKVKATSAVLPQSMEYFLVPDSAVRVTIYKFFRKGNGKIFGYAGMKTIKFDTAAHPGFELHLAAQGGWSK